jgi:hypothetical protein
MYRIWEKFLSKGKGIFGKFLQPFHTQNVRGPGTKKRKFPKSFGPKDTLVRKKVRRHRKKGREMHLPTSPFKVLAAYLENIKAIVLVFPP